MHTLRTVTKSSTKFLTAICVLALLFASCEKVDFEETSDQTAISEIEQISVEEQSNLLQQVYNLPTKEMSENQIRTYYGDFMKHTSAEDRTLLREQLTTILADQTAGSRTVHAKSAATILSPGGATSNFGYGVTTNRDQVLIGDSGEVSVYEQSGSGYTKVQSISIADGAGTILSAAGDWLAVGYPGSFVNDYADSKVILFKYDRGTWVEKQTLTAPGLSLYGEDVAMDLKSMAVLARESGANSIIIRYRYDGISWKEAERMGSGNFFWDMDMHRGQIVANGFQGFDFFNSKVYIYTTSFRGTTEQTVPIPGALSRQISIDGGNILAGVAFKPFFAGRSNSGFVYTSNRGTWSLAAELTMPVPFTSAAQGLGLKIKGNKALVSNPVFSYCCGSQEGDAVYVFEGSGRNWNLTKTLTPSDDNGIGSIYGTETGLAIHGNKVLVGAPGLDGATGKVYVH